MLITGTNSDQYRGKKTDTKINKVIYIYTPNLSSI